MCLIPGSGSRYLAMILQRAVPAVSAVVRRPSPHALCNVGDYGPGVDARRRKVSSPGATSTQRSLVLRFGAVSAMMCWQMHRAARSHTRPECSRYNRFVFQALRTARMTRRRLTMRATTLLLATIVAVVGLWCASHADDLGLTAPAATAIASPVGVNGEHVVDTSAEALALATLLSFALRFRLVRFQRRRPLPGPINFSSAFDRHGRRRIGLLELNLLRI